MYSIVDIAGKQFNVRKDQVLVVPKLKSKIGTIGTTNKVLLFSDDSDVKVGNPYVKGLSVKYKVIDYIKDDKVVVFKKKRRTGYHKKQGFRHQYTKILIEDIVKIVYGA